MSQMTPDLPADLMEPAEGEPSGRITATFKEGTGYDSAWIVVEADTFPELSNLIQRGRQIGAFEGVRRVAAEFRGPLHRMQQAAPADPLDAAVELVKAAIPGATEVPDAGPLAQSMGMANDPALAAQRAANAGPPKQTDSKPCVTCGQPAIYREGTGRNGEYKGYSCTADRTHFENVK